MELDDRKHKIDSYLGYEDKLAFNIICKCTKLFSFWAAETMGMSAIEAGTLAAEMVTKKMEEPGFENILYHITSLMEQKDVAVSETVMFIQLDRCMAEAQDEVRNTVPVTA